jgi:hypothetical protein
MHLSQKLIRYLVLAGLGIIAISCTATSPNINIGGIPLDKNYPFQAQVLSYIEGDSLLTAETCYYWPRNTGDTTHYGTTKPIDYMGARISDVWDNNGTHCVGITWQLVMGVLQDWAVTQDSSGQILDMTPEDIREFADMWFVQLEKGSDLSTLAVPVEMGSTYALSSYGLGYRVPMKEARPGDFVQFWRAKGSGHSCIFLHWINDGRGKIIGFKYWSSQPQTKGLGMDTEYFVVQDAYEADKVVDKNRFYVGRLMPIRSN